MPNLAYTDSNPNALRESDEYDQCLLIYSRTGSLDEANDFQSQDVNRLACLEQCAKWQFLDIELPCSPAELTLSTNTLPVPTAIYRQVEQEKANES